MAMRQNDSGVTLNTVRIAAPMTAGWVTATTRPLVRLTESSQPAVRLINAVRDSPPWVHWWGRSSTSAARQGRRR